MAFAQLSLDEGEQRLSAYGFGPHAVHNLCALAASGGVGQLRVMSMVVSVTMAGSRFRFEATQDGPPLKRFDTFEVEAPYRTSDCLCEPRRSGPCDACWERLQNRPRRLGPPLQ